jgi:hypothetical protein
MDLVVTSYCIYLLVGLALTLKVGQLLFNRGAIYLQDVFGANQELANATNQLLRIGFYLILGGYILVTLKISGQVTEVREVIEALAGKLGAILLAIGLLHLFNLLLLSTIRKNRMAEAKAEREWEERKKKTDIG